MRLECIKVWYDILDKAGCLNSAVQAKLNTSQLDNVRKTKCYWTTSSKGVFGMFRSCSSHMWCPCRLHQRLILNKSSPYFWCSICTLHRLALESDTFYTNQLYRFFSNGSTPSCCWRLISIDSGFIWKDIASPFMSYSLFTFAIFGTNVSLSTPVISGQLYLIYLALVA